VKQHCHGRRSTAEGLREVRETSSFAAIGLRLKQQEVTDLILPSTVLAIKGTMRDPR